MTAARFNRAFCFGCRYFAAAPLEPPVAGTGAEAGEPGLLSIGVGLVSGGLPTGGAVGVEFVKGALPIAGAIGAG